MKKILLDRVPGQFCEGPFWGNGTMGSVLYTREGMLRISIDHAGLWEMRETLPDEPKAVFSQILQHQERFLSGDPAYVEDTNIFDRAIGRTKLPALAVELKLPGKITDFRAETDLCTAETALSLKMDEHLDMEGRVWLDSKVNVWYLELEGGGDGVTDVRAPGWDLESPRLKPLKNWNYEKCQKSGTEEAFTVIQHFGGGMSAVLAGKQVRTERGMALAVSIDVGRQEEEEKMLLRGSVLAGDYLQQTDRYRKAHRRDWADYWAGFSVSIPDDRLQEAFELEMYKLYCNERENGMPVTLQGVWNTDARMPAWFGDLHNDLNVQSCYWPAYKTGNVDLVRPYVKYYTDASPRFEERAWKLFGIKDAIHVPIMMAPDGTGAASEWCYWNSILGPELFVAVDFVWFYEYSRDRDTLRERIYPFIEKVLHLYQGIASEKEDGWLHIPFTLSPEVERDGHILMADDATFTLSSLHFLCRRMAEYASLLGRDGSGFLAWEKRLAPVETDETGYPVYAGIDVFTSHRHFGQMYPIFPLCEEAHNEVANRSLDTAINQGFLEFAAFSFPYLGIMAARCGRGNMCRTMLEMYCMVFRSRNSFTVNGDPYQNGVLRVSGSSAGENADAFTLESGFFVPTLICEMLLHRAGDDVWLMMGIPDEWKDCGCRDLTIEGGHRVSLERKNYGLRRAVLRARAEEKLVLRWKDEAALLRLTRDGEEITFQKNTKCAIFVRPGEEWLLEFGPRDPEREY